MWQSIEYEVHGTAEQAIRVQEVRALEIILVESNLVKL